MLHGAESMRLTAVCATGTLYRLQGRLVQYTTPSRLQNTGEACVHTVATTCCPACGMWGLSMLAEPDRKPARPLAQDHAQTVNTLSSCIRGHACQTTWPTTAPALAQGMLRTVRAESSLAHASALREATQLPHAPILQAEDEHSWRPLACVLLPPVLLCRNRMLVDMDQMAATISQPPCSLQ